jgi:hypothetical protein
MSGDMTIRRIEDLDSTALTYAEVKAIASANLPVMILSLHASFNGGVELILHGKNNYSARVMDAALGTVRSLESIVRDSRNARRDLNATYATHSLSP